MGDDTGAATAILVFYGLWALFSLVYYAWYAYSLSKLFPHLGVESWKGWVPILNDATILNLAGFPAWYIAFNFFPIVNLYGLVVRVQAVMKLNAAAGRGGAMTVIGIVLPPLWATFLTQSYSEAGSTLVGRAALSAEPKSVTPRREENAMSSTPPSPHDGSSWVNAMAIPISPSPHQQDHAADADRVPPPYTLSAPSAGAMQSPLAPPSAPLAGAPVPVPPPPPSGFSASAPTGTPLPPPPPSGFSAPAPTGTPLAPPPAPVVVHNPWAPAAAEITEPPQLTLAPLAPPALVAEVPPALVAEVPLVPPAPAGPELVSAPTSPSAYPPPPALEELRPLPPTVVAPPPIHVTTSQPESVQVLPEPVPAGGSPELAAEVVASPPAPVPDDDDDDDEDGKTIVVDRKPRIRWYLEVDDVGQFPVTAASVILGRKPSSTAPGTQALAIPDSTRTLSKVHARLDLRDDAWIITDLNSTNGVMLVAEDGTETLLDAGASAAAGGRFILGELGMSLGFAS